MESLSLHRYPAVSAILVQKFFHFLLKAIYVYVEIPTIVI